MGGRRGGVLADPGPAWTWRVVAGVVLLLLAAGTARAGHPRFSGYGLGGGWICIGIPWPRGEISTGIRATLGPIGGGVTPYRYCYNPALEESWLMTWQPSVVLALCEVRPFLLLAKAEGCFWGAPESEDMTLLPFDFLPIVVLGRRQHYNVDVTLLPNFRSESPDTRFGLVALHAGVTWFEGHGQFDRSYYLELGIGGYIVGNWGPEFPPGHMPALVNTIIGLLR